MPRTYDSEPEEGDDLSELESELESSEDPICIAVIYFRILLLVPLTEVLHGIVYVGQSVSGKFDTAEEVAKSRWGDENSESKQKDKDVGLPAALATFGPGAFVDTIKESKRGPRSKVQKWANEREIFWIKELGGTLVDMKKRMRQTLNILPGGKGGCSGHYAQDATRSFLFSIFKEEMEAYVLMNGDSLVPSSYVSPSGYNLGKNLSAVRRNGVFWKGHPLEGERVEWLESLPKWTWSCYDSAWETFKEEMQAYVDENGTSLVPRNIRLSVCVQARNDAGRCPFQRLFLEGKPRRGGEEGMAAKLERVDVELSRFRMGEISNGDAGVRG